MAGRRVVPIVNARQVSWRHEDAVSAAWARVTGMLLQRRSHEGEQLDGLEEPARWLYSTFQRMWQVIRRLPFLDILLPTTRVNWVTKLPKRFPKSAMYIHPVKGCLPCSRHLQKVGGTGSWDANHTDSGMITHKRAKLYFYVHEP